MRELDLNETLIMLCYGVLSEREINIKRKRGLFRISNFLGLFREPVLILGLDGFLSFFFFGSYYF